MAKTKARKVRRAASREASANVSPKPKYNACTPFTVSDGIQTATHYHFDTTIEFTPDDNAALEKCFEQSTPRDRIQSMQERLATLEPITDQYIQEHVNTIRAIHASLKRF